MHRKRSQKDTRFQSTHVVLTLLQMTPTSTAISNASCVPIVHINRAVMVLELPSDVTLKAK